MVYPRDRMAEKARRGRPPVQHIKHVHTLALSPELEEAIGELQETYLKGRIVSALGRATRGLLSHPAGIGAIAAVIAAIWFFLLGGRQAIEEKGRELSDAAIDVLANITTGAYIGVTGGIALNREVWTRLFQAFTRIPKGPLFPTP